MCRWPALLLLLLLLPLLAACELRGLDWLIDRAADAVLGEPQQPSPPGVALRFSLSRRPGWFALVSAQGPRRVWRSPGQEVVVTEGDRVVGTGGFPVLLAALRHEGGDPLEDWRSIREGPPREFRRVVDLMPENRRPEDMLFGLRVTCLVEVITTEVPLRDDGDADIDDTADPSFIEASLVLTEHCRGEGVGEFLNRFTLHAESGLVRRSVQWIGPGLPMLRLGRITRRVNG